MSSIPPHEVMGGTRTRFWRVYPPAALLFVVLRVPSFFEPTWYTDEAGYATTARALLRGHVLYVDAWTNKPPLQVWTVAAVLRVAGPSEWALHALTCLSGLLALSALAYAAASLLSPARCWLAVVLGTVLLGAPLIGSELAIPENVLIAPTAWAAALLLTRIGFGGRWWPLAVGALAAMALGYQQTALADAAAFAAIIVLAAARPLRSLVLYLVTLLAGTALWLVPAILLAGVSRVAFALVGFYIAFTASVLPHSRSGLVLHAGLLVLATALVLTGCYVLRHRPLVTWASWLWAVATGLVTAAAHQPYAHYLVPAIVPLALAVASLPLPSRLAWRPPRAAGVAAIVASVAITSFLASVIGDDWMIWENWTGGYYAGFAGVVAGRQPLERWQRGFDNRVEPTQAVTAWLRGHQLEGSRAVVWSGDSWLYLTGDLQLLLPTAPVYNDEVLFGEGGPVADRVAKLDPEVIVTAGAAPSMFPEIKPLLRDRYHVVFRSQGETVWLRDGTTVPGG